MLHWGPFQLKSGRNILWSSEYENLYGDVINIPCSGGHLVDAIVILDASNSTSSPRSGGNEEDHTINNKGWNQNSSGLGRFLSTSQTTQKAKGLNGEYLMTNSQTDAHRVRFLCLFIFFF